ncbi:MAG: FAD-dependent monooxygenase [Candidatus Tectomicrobia bacterium]|nr:FAD-dependent monooxygenase [Candidatus Tectomicrobia bacterium]
MIPMSYDVIVAGAGPGGAAAAYLCAKAGLRVLLLEREKLPRDKTCTGMLMCVGISELRRIFGRFPREVLAEPAEVRGWMVHVPGAGSAPVEHETYQSWRRDLDAWCAQRAVEAGATVRDETTLRHVEQDGDGYAVRVKTPRAEETLRCRYVVGADGASSHVRKCLWPDLQVRYSHGLEKWYPEVGRVAPRWFHCLTHPGMAPLYSDVIIKDGTLVYEIGFRRGQQEEVDRWTMQFVEEVFGLSLPKESTHRLGCGTALLYFAYLKGSFQPAKGNALLIGDAGGLMLPIIGEGIGGSLYTGRVAAESILRAADDGAHAAALYLAGLRAYLEVFLRICGLSKGAQQAARRSPQDYLAAMVEAVATSFSYAQELVG